MKSGYRRARWICLISYLWVATGIGDAAFFSAMVAGHDNGTVVVESASDADMVVHHVGHRDTHEPYAVDADDKQFHDPSIQGHSHADHFFERNSTQQANGFSGTDLKVPKNLDGFAALLVVSTVELPSPVSTRRAIDAVQSSSNTALAFVKLTQLRL